MHYFLSYKRCNYEKIEVCCAEKHSECALACITMLLNYYQSTLVELREKYGVPKGGLTIKIFVLSLTNMVDVSTFKSSFSNYLDLPTPVISYWNNQHFVVIEKIKKKKILILQVINAGLIFQNLKIFPIY